MNAQHPKHSSIIDESRYDEWRCLPAMFFDQAERLADRPLLISKHDGVWRDQSWGEVASAITKAAGGLRSLGVGHGDRVAIVSENRPEWLIADFAIMLLGAITVPAYTTSTTADHLHTLRDSGARVVLVSSAALMRKVLPASLQLPDIRAVVSFNEDAGGVISGAASSRTVRKCCIGTICWSVAAPAWPSIRRWRRWSAPMSPA